MVIHKRVSEDEGECEVLLKAADGDKAAGKFLLGRPLPDTGRTVLVFDAAARFHKDIAVAHHLRPLGGGWCEINHQARTVRLSGASQAFGREPDRERTVRCFSQCLPGYRCEALE